MKPEARIIILIFTCCLQVVSTLVKYPGGEKQYYNIFRRSTNMLAKINGLLTKAGIKVVRKAAALLIRSERYDDYFFEELRSQSIPENITASGNCISLGQHYAVVRKNVVETAKTVEIMEVRK